MNEMSELNRVRMRDSTALEFASHHYHNHANHPFIGIYHAVDCEWDTVVVRAAPFSNSGFAIHDFTDFEGYVDKVAEYVKSLAVMFNINGLVIKEFNYHDDGTVKRTD